MKNYHLFIILTLIACEPYKEANHLFPAREYGRVGYINEYGNFEIIPTFDDAKRFSEGLAAVKIDSLWGYIDSSGTIIIKPQFYDALDFSYDRALVELSNKKFEQAFIDRSGQIVFKPQEYTSSFKEGFARTEINEKVAFYNINGELEIITDYPYGDSFHEGLAKIWTGDSTRYINKRGETIIKLSRFGHGNFSEGLASARISGKNVYIDTTGSVVLEVNEPVSVIFDFSEGLAEVVTPFGNQKRGFINKKGEFVVNLTPHVLNQFQGGYAAYLDDNKWGFYNKKGEIALSPQFDNIDHFEDGLCWVEKDHLRGYINEKGRFVWVEDDLYMYRKVDTSLWKLDTLEISSTPLAERRVYHNQPQILDSDSIDTFQIHVDMESITPYADKYFGHKIYLANGSSDTIQIDTQDGRIKLLLQGLNEEGSWQYLENFIDSWCGNSYYHVDLPPNNYFVFSYPVTNGDLETKLRFELIVSPDVTIYSNEFSGKISKKQFLTVDLGSFKYL